MVQKTDRVTTGLTKLDALTCGGFPSKTVILISGSAGTGKTLFGLNFLVEGARRGERCCYISFSESADELMRACEGIESLRDAKRYAGKNLILQYVDIGKLTLNKFVHTLALYPDVDRLVIDNINKLLLFAETDRKYRIAMVKVINNLKKKAGCSLLLCETAAGEVDTGKGESFECDGLVNISFLDLEEKPMRTLEIHKLRYTAFDPRVVHNIVISSKGLELGDAKLI
ncbi:MAG: hypothetical protein DRN71_03150 [Candidatus Nanohalarchaeota archaeon]|nr:MAG: hypothetical protein DRN71_03150 [Candidatus Nanohaloarchaeota archaeon]